MTGPPSSSDSLYYTLGNDSVQATTAMQVFVCSLYADQTMGFLWCRMRFLPGAAAGSPGPAQPTRTLFGAAANSAGFDAAIHTVVHRLGRHLGFQAFNVVPSTEVHADALQRYFQKFEKKVLVYFARSHWPELVL